MKALVLLLLSKAALASVLLTSPFNPGYTVNGVSISATNATATSDSFDWLMNTACVVYEYGTVTVSGQVDQTFTPLSGAPLVTNCLNLTTGAWNAYTSQGTNLASGTLTGAQLASAISTYTGPLTALRDAADYFASTTFLPGSQPDKWAAGDL